jgi:endo-1,4-beta-xylanase
VMPVVASFSIEMKYRPINPMRRRTFLKAATLGAGALAVGWPLSPAWAVAETLRDAAATRRVLAGSAISNSQLHDPRVSGLLAEQCSIVVPQNEMKWDSIHPLRNRYDFTAADELAAFAAQHSLRLRGHNLCWHDAQPPWLAPYATRENAAQLLEEHIHTVAGRYAGRIHSWDVVNEAIDPAGPDGGMRRSLWYNLLGKDYISIAFQAAHKADPNALLTYNDYGLEEQGNDHEDRRDATLALLRWMRKNRIPIDALGLQSHLTAHYDELPDWSGMHDFLKKVAKLEIKVFITELDVDDSNLYGGKPGEADREIAWICKNYLDNVLKHPQVEAVLTWGLVSHGVYGAKRDDDAHRALPYNERLEPSPFLASMVEALRKH